MTGAPTAPQARASANARLLRDLLRAQVSLQRVQARLFGRDLLPILLKAEREILRALAALHGDGATMDAVSRARIEELLVQVQRILANAGGQAGAGMTATLADVANRERRMLVAAARKALPAVRAAAWNTLPVNQVATAAAQTGAEMVGPWFQRWSAAGVAAVKSQVEQGVALGLDVDQMARRVAAAMGQAKGQAMAITRTAVARVAADIRAAWIDGNRDLWKGKQWVATLDTRTCPVCGPLDGRVWYYEPQAGQEGVSSMPDAPAHPNCRCTVVPVAYSLEELEARARGQELVKPEPPPEVRASMDGDVPGTLTWQDWLASQPAGVQRSILGPTAYEQWRQRGILESFSVPFQRLIAAGLRLTRASAATPRVRRAS